jgi:mRNA interferase YafQ
MRYSVVETARFLKSLKKVSQYKQFDRRALERVLVLLQENKPLDTRHKDHELKGVLAGIRECHIKNDLLLMYQKRDDILVLLLIDIGTHSSLFGE